MTDEEIMAGLARNDPKAFVAFEKKYKERIFAIARNVFNNNIVYETLEELYFEVLFNVWKVLFKGEKINKLFAFSAKVARNRSITRLNYEKKHQHDEITDDSLDGGNEPGDKLLEKELIKMIMEKINSLNPIDQKILSLYYNEELKFNEIAKILDTSTAAVGQRLRRALVKIRDTVEDQVDH